METMTQERSAMNQANQKKSAAPSPAGAERAGQKKEALDRAVQQIEKAFGKGSIMQLDKMPPLGAGISTGALSLDLALGGRGLPRGRVVEMFGPESSGKTTLALHAIAAAQREGGVAAFIDAEHALDPSWAKRCGVKLEQLLVSQPDSGEQALEICELLVRSGSVDVIVVDSVAALIPRAEIEGQMGDTHVALQARLMSQALRKLTSSISKTGCVVIFINQVRMKIGVMFGNPETTPGGKALKFYSSVRVEIRRVTSVKEGEAIIGNRVKAKVVKNKVAAPFREAEFDILFDCGISREGDLLDLATEDSIVSKSGTWLSYKDVRLGQGRENARTFLASQPDLFAEIHNAVLAKRTAPEPSSETESKAPAPSNGAAPKPAPTESKADAMKPKVLNGEGRADPAKGKFAARRA